MSFVVGIRGAIICPENTKESILESTRELLVCVTEANDLTEDQIAGVFLTATPDLDADFPAYALRDMGWRNTAALCAHEMSVPGAWERVIRIMIFVNRDKALPIRHQYIGEARALRPDLADLADRSVSEQDSHETR